MNFKEDQDVRIKVGYEVFNKVPLQQLKHVVGSSKIKCFGYLLKQCVVVSFFQVPYMQIRENNWTLNANMKGKWNLRFDL